MSLRFHLPKDSGDVPLAVAARFPGDKRTLMDFRRSGAIEAKAGAVDPAALADKMANSIDTNRQLQATYMPMNLTSVRSADGSRMVGRGKLRDGK